MMFQTDDIAGGRSMLPLPPPPPEPDTAAPEGELPVLPGSWGIGGVFELPDDVVRMVRQKSIAESRELFQYILDPNSILDGVNDDEFLCLLKKV